MKDNVIDIPVKFKLRDDSKFLIVKRDRCLHANFLVDDKKQEVECGQCGEKLNPMYVLHRLAIEENKWHKHHDRYKEEMQRLEERSKTKCQHCKQMTRISRS